MLKIEENSTIFTALIGHAEKVLSAIEKLVRWAGSYDSLPDRYSFLLLSMSYTAITAQLAKFCYCFCIAVGSSMAHAIYKSSSSAHHQGHVDKAILLARPP